MGDNLLDLIRPAVRTRHKPPADPIELVGDPALRRAAGQCGIKPYQAAAACLEAGIWPERYAANRGAFSAADQARLADSVVAVIGAGGLGGMVILQLARMGVGRLKVCDGDLFEPGNLNRQFLCTMSRLNKNKAQCSVQEVARVNPLTEVVPVDDWATPENLPDILSGCRVAVDCLDNMPTRYALEEAAAQSGIAYVHGALAGLEGFVMTVRPGDPGLAGLYGPDPAPKEASAEVLMGTPTMTPALVAGLQVNEVVKLLLDRPTLRRGEVLHLDLERPETEIMHLHGVPPQA